jgi:hypothetical protein
VPVELPEALEPDTFDVTIIEGDINRAGELGFGIEVR